MRIVPAAARRLQALGVDGPLMPRLLGIRRFIWAKRQKQLADVRPYLAALAEAGIVPLVTKGTARVALDPHQASERFSHDVDLAFAEADWERAVDLMLARGLVPSPPWPRDQIVRRMREWRHSIAFESGELTIDMHLSALFANRCVGDDRPMRRRAVPARLAGVPVLVPSAADRLVMAMGHGLYCDRDRPADWVLDAAAALEAPDLDWGTLEAEARARGLSAFVATGLAFLTDELGRQVPGAVRARLHADAGPLFAEELDSVFHSHAPATARAAATRYLAAAERAERALVRWPAEMPLPVPHAPPPAGWQSASPGARRSAMIVVPAIDPHALAQLELKLPAVRSLSSQRLAFELRCNFEVETMVTDWQERVRRRLDTRVVTVRIPGAFLVLRAIEELRLRGWRDGPLGKRHRLPLDGLAYRWTKIR